MIPDDVEWRHYGRTTKNGVQFVALLDRSAALLDWRRGAHFGTRHHRHLVELGPAAHSAHRARAARAPVPSGWTRGGRQQGPGLCRCESQPARGPCSESRVSNLRSVLCLSALFRVVQPRLLRQAAARRTRNKEAHRQCCLIHCRGPEDVRELDECTTGAPPCSLVNVGSAT